MAIKITTPPAAEPVSLAEAKVQLRWDAADEDDLITSMIVSARRLVERVEWRQLITATITMKLAGFPRGVIYVPRPPLQSVTSIQYVDTNGDPQTWDTSYYEYDAFGEPGVIRPVSGQWWPAVADQLNAVTVVYVAGYGDDATDVPSETRSLILMLVDYLWNNRSVVSPVDLTELPIGLNALSLPCHDERVLDFV